MTKTITIDGETVSLKTGDVCIGYYEDDIGRVVDRFAVSPGDYRVPEAVSVVNYVTAFSELPTIDPHYKPET